MGPDGAHGYDEGLGFKISNVFHPKIQSFSVAETER